MNPDFLPAIGASLRALCEFATRHDVNDQTLTELAAEIEKARAAVAGARGAVRANRCVRHPGSPFDPTAENGCLLCGPTVRRPARPIPEDFVPGDVLLHVEEHGQDAATERYGAQAVARALMLSGRHPSKTQRRGIPATQQDKGETDR
ncbi:hypothetical protein ACIQZO_34935 [Streptomyces sp. NPDC097617]|uniref:hypothetical protein n=1 Tax=Streptomyces sp. NPDC097617 TaxID=3366091 RepID=UPI0038297049